MIPYFARDSITRVFYAFHDSKTPLLVGLLAIGLKYLLNLWLVPIYGIKGITFGITIMTFFNMTLLGILSKRHIQDLGFKEMVMPFIKLAAAGLVMAGCIFLLYSQAIIPTQLQHLLPLSGKMFRYGFILLSSLVGLIVYIIAMLMLKVPEAEYLKERFAGRFLKRRA
jgi:putative peptidoglycan lipid II flippase